MVYSCNPLHIPRCNLLHPKGMRRQCRGWPVLSLVCSTSTVSLSRRRGDCVRHTPRTRTALRPTETYSRWVCPTSNPTAILGRHCELSLHNLCNPLQLLRNSLGSLGLAERTLGYTPELTTLQGAGTVISNFSPMREAFPLGQPQPSLRPSLWRPSGLPKAFLPSLRLFPRSA